VCGRRARRSPSSPLPRDEARDPPAVPFESRGEETSAPVQADPPSVREGARRLGGTSLGSRPQSLDPEGGESRLTATLDFATLPTRKRGGTERVGDPRRAHVHNQKG
jgi:hypothetical protein